MNGHTVLLVIAIVCELVGALGIPLGDPYRHSAIALGLMFFFISFLVAA
jgi:hypothetical protein